jgi:hypothetical protein
MCVTNSALLLADGRLYTRQTLIRPLGRRRGHGASVVDRYVLCVTPSRAPDPSRDLQGIFHRRGGPFHRAHG